MVRNRIMWNIGLGLMKKVMSLINIFMVNLFLSVVIEKM